MMCVVCKCMLLSTRVQHTWLKGWPFTNTISCCKLYTGCRYLSKSKNNVQSRHTIKSELGLTYTIIQDDYWTRQLNVWLTDIHLNNVKIMPRINRTMMLTFLLNGSLLSSKTPSSFCPLTSMFRRYSSYTLYGRELEEKSLGHVDVNLDLSTKLKDVHALEQNIKARHLDIPLEKLVKDFRLLQSIIKKRTELESEKKDIAKKMGLMSKKETSSSANQYKDEFIARGREVRQMLKDVMNEYHEIENLVMPTALQLPNDIWPDTPYNAMSIERSFGTKSEVSQMSHIDTAEKQKLIHFSDIGDRSFYTKGSLVHLEMAVLEYFSDKLSKLGFIPISSPNIFRSFVVEGCGLNAINPSEMYQLASKENFSSFHEEVASSYYLHGISELLMAAYLTRMNINGDALPFKYYTTGRHYCPDIQRGTEAGLYGARQSVMGGCWTVCSCDGEAHQEFTRLQDEIWNMYKEFQLPMRLITVPAMELKLSEKQRREVQIWAPALQEYITVAALSSFGDYISRRLMIRLHDRKLNDYRYVHMVYAKVMDVSKIAAWLLEYYDNEKDAMSQIPALNKHRI